MRIAILCNGRTLSAWQRAAVAQIAEGNELFLLLCGDGRPAPRRWANALYYVLNLFSIRNYRSRRVPFPDSDFASSGEHRCSCDFERAWAVLPDSAIGWLQDQRIDAVVKFGLNLLRIPPPDRLAVPILSYHHGDPRRFRGRPAGFYELLRGENFVGQIVQRLSNRLDAGSVLAFAETRVVRSSYRATLLGAYALSPHLLPKALDAVREGRVEPIEATGAVYRLPGNATVLRFVAIMAWYGICRLAYGAMIEKRWNVSTATVPASADPVAVVRHANDRRAAWSRTAILPGYTFYADPFFHGGEDDYVVEALRSRTGKGELVRIEGARQRPISGLAGHTSYPVAIAEGGVSYVVPETAGWARPAIYRIDGDRAAKVADLDLNEPGILDPTPLRHGDRVYLFGNRASEGGTVLSLWHAPSLLGRFEPHPASPIRLGARGSRMGGAFMRVGETIYRLGQDCRKDYGDGLVVFALEALDAFQYREREIGCCSFDGVRGPHTLGRCGDTALFDWYTDRFSLLAGARRVLNRI